MSKTKNMSTVGFILSAIGAAVGLGNIWRFPTHLMNYGGAAFLIPYLIAVLLLGLPLLIIEINLGQKWRKAPVVFFKEYFGKKHGAAFAWVQAGLQLLVATYYAIIISWVVIYAFGVLGINDNFSLEKMQKPDFFDENISNVESLKSKNKLFGEFNWIVFGGFATVILLTVLIVAGGLTGGIEKVNKIMVPSLFLIIVGFFCYSSTFPNSGVGIRIIFEPDWQKLATPDAWKSAFGQALFTLSLAVSIIVIYSAGAPKNGDNTNRAITIMAGDTLIALLSCVIVGCTLGYGLNPNAGSDTTINPLFKSVLDIKGQPLEVENGLVEWTGPEIENSSVVIFNGIAYNIDEQANIKYKEFAGGPGLIFRVLPITFHLISGGNPEGDANILGKILAFFFYIAVFFAAMSSMFGLIEPTVCNLIGGYGFKRFWAVTLAGAIAFIFGFWFAFSGADIVWHKLTDDFFTNNILLISALIELFGIAFFWKKQKSLLKHNNKNSIYKIGRWFQCLLITSFLLTLAVFIYGMVENFINLPYKDFSYQQKLTWWLTGSFGYLIPFLFLVIGFGYIWKPKTFKENKQVTNNA